jgi:hypothetical protein
VVGAHEEVFAFDLALQTEPTSTSDYAEKIEQAAAAGWSFSRVVTAYRWLNYVNTEVSIDISDGYRVVSPSPHRHVRALRKLHREVGRLFGLRGYYPEVQGRSQPLKNAAKLTFAIVNNMDSHIGAFPSSSPGGATEEGDQIAKAYQSIMESICAPEDDLYRSRFETVLSNRGKLSD